MKTHRFFIDADPAVDWLHDDEITITDPDVLHQWNRVLRFRPGTPVVLLDNTGNEFHGVIREISQEVAYCSKIHIKFFANYPQVRVKLYPALLKKDKFDWVLQKCTELGVWAFHPIVSERTEKTGFNIERAEKIVREASEQSERPILPTIDEPSTLKDVLDEVGDVADGRSETVGDADANETWLALHMDGTPLCNVKQSVRDIADKTEDTTADTKPRAHTYHILIGPEGGWTDNELELFTKKGIEITKIGNQNSASKKSTSEEILTPTLRAETASVAIATLMLLE